MKDHVNELKIALEKLETGIEIVEEPGKQTLRALVRKSKSAVEKIEQWGNSPADAKTATQPVAPGTIVLHRMDFWQFSLEQNILTLTRGPRIADEVTLGDNAFPLSLERIEITLIMQKKLEDVFELGGPRVNKEAIRKRAVEYWDKVMRRLPAQEHYSDYNQYEGFLKTVRDRLLALQNSRLDGIDLFIADTKAQAA